MAGGADICWVSGAESAKTGGISWLVCSDCGNDVTAAGSSSFAVWTSFGGAGWEGLGVASFLVAAATMGVTRLLRGVGNRNLDLVGFVAVLEGVDSTVLETGGGARSFRRTGVANVFLGLLAADAVEDTLPAPGVGGLGLSIAAVAFGLGDAGGVAALGGGA